MAVLKATHPRGLANEVKGFSKKMLGFSAISCLLDKRWKRVYVTVQGIHQRVKEEDSVKIDHWNSRHLIADLHAIGGRYFRYFFHHILARDYYSTISDLST